MNLITNDMNIILFNIKMALTIISKIKSSYCDKLYNLLCLRVLKPQFCLAKHIFDAIV